MDDVENLWLYVIIGVVIIALGVGVAVSLLRGRGRPEREVEAPPSTGAPGLPAEELERRPETEASSAGTVTTEAPEETLPPISELLPTIERPESARGRLQRLRARLARSNTALGKGLLVLLSRGRLDEEAWEDVEDTLIGADLGVEATEELIASLRTQVKVDGTTDEATAREWLREDLLRLVQPDMDRRIASSRVGVRPAVILVVGVNGTGKTTTVGKLARVLVAEDRDVLLGAADTFRAAAADQLDTWGARVGVPTGPTGRAPTLPPSHSTPSGPGSSRRSTSSSSTRRDACTTRPT